MVGHREICTVNLEAAAQGYFQTLGTSVDGGSGTLCLKGLYEFVDKMTPSVAQAYNGEDNLFFATVGLRDLCYLPPGWIFHERVKDQTDYVGFRRQVIIRGTQSLLEKTNLTLVSYQKPNLNLQSVVDFLNDASTGPA